jgi:hypothetical protein
MLHSYKFNTPKLRSAAIIISPTISVFDGFAFGFGCYSEFFHKLNNLCMLFQKRILRSNEHENAQETQVTFS